MKTRTSLALLTLAVGLPFGGSAFAQSTPAAPKSASTTAAKPATAHKAGTATALPKNIPPAHGVVKIAYSLKYIDTKVGTGELATPMKWYTVHYTGWLASDGTKFDSSVDRGQPATFPVGMGHVIPGWDSGFAGMRIGGKRRLFIPYQLAYGERGRPPKIPPKSDLIFDVELISISDKPPAPPTPPHPPAGAPGQPAKPAVPGAPIAPTTPPAGTPGATPGSAPGAVTPKPATPPASTAPAAPATPPAATTAAPATPPAAPASKPQ